MLHPKSSSHTIVLLALIAFAPVFLIGGVRFAQDVGAELKSNVIQTFVSITRKPPSPVRGIYLTSYSAGSTSRRQELFDLVERTELNAVVIDIKASHGAVAYATKLPFAVRHGLVAERPYGIGEILFDARSRGIWTIARFPVFEDPTLAEARPDLALRTESGETWATRKGVAWLDPTQREVWQYAADLARDALRHGFDEVQFDYVRFPSDGRLGDAVYADWSEESGVPRYVAMGEFFAFLRDELGPQARISADFFGLTMDASPFPDYDLLIGQRLRDALPQFDVISPMVYPSHYYSGYQDLAKPAAHPGIVVAATLDAANPFLQDDYTKIRPWLQDFDLGAIYTPAMVRAQIDAVEERGADGWLLWNPRNIYTEEALQPAAG